MLPLPAFPSGPSLLLFPLSSDFPPLLLIPLRAWIVIGVGALLIIGAIVGIVVWRKKAGGNGYSKYYQMY